MGYPDISSRKKAFCDKNGLEPCDICFGVNHAGKCNPSFICALRYCDKKEPHAIVLCPINVESTKRFNITLGSIFSASSKLQRSVALQTAMYCCHNETCKNISSERRNLSVLADSGAQCTLISRECVNLPVIRPERASLQGYG